MATKSTKKNTKDFLGTFLIQSLRGVFVSFVTFVFLVTQVN